MPTIRENSSDDDSHQYEQILETLKENTAELWKLQIWALDLRIRIF